ncbi:flavoprotein [Streptomyces sp. Ag109_O5-1]|uniref:flavoprotein n=1 Tax=Streptomyces sp. Ag109_O5-1 TaxID=1938851 RepID=UPI000F4F98E9|nr:flavoprotein [Streptomyces sp. Ag109_O5-1]
MRTLVDAALEEHPHIWAGAGSCTPTLSESLVERAADVMLKQRRKLFLCLREAPLNLIHLRNMVAVTEAGATVYPMVPTHYNVPETLAQLRDEFVERVLQFLGLPGTDRYQWDGTDTAARRAHA